MIREFIITLITLFIFSNTILAYELVLPKDKKTVVNTEYAFFVGSVKKNEAIDINDEHIHTAPNGAFAHSVKLKDGENRIVIRSNYKRQVYKIIKEPPVKNIDVKLSEFEQRKYLVKADNTPLRNTPIDFGINRVAHLFKGTHLIIDGEKGDFFRVFLSKNKYAWIAKKDVEIYEEEISPKFITMDSQTFKNASVHILEFNEKLPYSIEETNKEIIFKVYNPFVQENSVYTVNIKKPNKYTYKLNLTEGVYNLKVSSLPILEEKNLEGLTITVDPGHGGLELGALGCLNDNEKDINLKIALELKEILSQMGANVIMTRDCDANVSLSDRVKIAEDNCTNIFISIHLNSIPDIKMNIHKNSGTGVYYYNENSKELAKIMEKSLTSILKTRNDGVHQASFAVIRPTSYVGVLVETAYMTNPYDSVLYLSDDFSRKAAQGIADGILNYAFSLKKCK